ncbi:hypothetical protein RND71_018695 [Anisodus tanguticus]|uniref:Uncharacterized protein n=1 Tax=Anisodus tanguticus TaxID=243964 RepID=A0AAE1S5V3_9SOLA|nr:hypothetical protein RND71_018695 [Anisodus tanguticus]
MRRQGAKVPHSVLFMLKGTHFIPRLLPSFCCVHCLFERGKSIYCSSSLSSMPWYHPSNPKELACMILKYPDYPLLLSACSQQSLSDPEMLLITVSILVEA